MTKLGIDVSKYNGRVDWNKVKSAGKEFAIIRITQKDYSKDEQFEANWNGAKAVGIEIYGVYNYSYATTPTEAFKEANAVVKALAGRKTIVWMDVEDKCQKGQGTILLESIKAYKQTIEDSGNRFGIYTGESFYKSYIAPWLYTIKGSKFWIARYGKDNGKKDVKYQPQIPDMVLWQYSSKGKVQGVVDNVDLDVCYDPSFFSSVSTSTSKTVKNPYTEPTRLLRYKTLNMRGEDVKWVQFWLVQKGYMPSSNEKNKTNIDGIYGKGTMNAVLTFQKDKNIEADGIVGQQTRKFLKG